MNDADTAAAAAKSSLILARVLRGIALNREPGWHFSGNFLEISFDRVDSGDTRVSLAAGPHCNDREGRANLGAVAMLADMALATSIRATLPPETRLATVSMHLQFTGHPARGRLQASGRFQGFVADARGRQGLAEVTLAGEAGAVCFGTGSFMALEPPPGVVMHPLPIRNAKSSPAAPLPQGALKDDELELLRRAEESLATMSHGDFLSRFWGYEPVHAPGGARCTLTNGAHVGNRVGHAQGGILMGLAAVTAEAALPSSWRLGSITACFVSPGIGAKLRARSKVVHRGRLTAVVRTEVLGAERKRVLEVLSTHSATKT
jgi:acyl-coenzyme A thioesterase PaaI-like protein